MVLSGDAFHQIQFSGFTGKFWFMAAQIGGATYKVELTSPGSAELNRTLFYTQSASAFNYYETDISSDSISSVAIDFFPRVSSTYDPTFADFIDLITLEGDVVAVPEPSSVLIALAPIFVLTHRRRGIRA
jgi:hypothetical protein